MPRKPTGRGRGRPVGSGQLGEEGIGHMRLTVRLPKELYDALEAAAEQEHYTREAPELARTVRRALEHYLTCSHKQPTGMVPHASLVDHGQTENVLEILEKNIRQTAIVPEPACPVEAPREDKRQTEKLSAMVSGNIRQTEIPPYDSSKHYLGKLCPHQHDYHGTGQSLRRLHNQGCRECERLGKRAARMARMARMAKRQAQPVYPN